MRLFLVSLSSFVLLASGQMMAGPIMMNGDSSMSMMKVADMAMMNGEVESKSQCQNFCEKTYPPHTFDNQVRLMLNIMIFMLKYDLSAKSAEKL